MARVLPMGVVERAVGMSLVVKRPDACSFEPRAEAELPTEGRLDIKREGPGGSNVRRQRCMNVIIGRSERQEASPLALRGDDTCEDSKRGSARSVGRPRVEASRENPAARRVGGDLDGDHENDGGPRDHG